MVNITAYSAEPAKIAIIGDTEKYQTEVDLLTVELSQDENIHLLERSDWDYLLREHEISQSNIAQKSVQFGRLLGADGLIILSEAEIKGKKYLTSKLLAVKTGIILDSFVSPIDKNDESFKWSDSIKYRFQPKFNKLRNSQNNIVTVSMLNLRSSLSTPALLTFEREINAIFAHRLMQEENIFVSERWNMAEATFEKHVGGEDESGFKTGTNIIEGSINLKDKNTIEIKLLVRSPDGKKQEIIVSDKKENLANFADKLTTEFLKVAKIAKNTIRYDKAKEAEEYYKEAKWAFNAGLFQRSFQSAESAWALGLRSEDMIFYRIDTYINAAYPDSEDNFISNLIDVHSSDKHINAAITALELYYQYVIKAKKREKYHNWPKRNLYDYEPNLIRLASYVLRSYYEQECILKDSNKIELLQRLILSIYEVALKNNYSYACKLAGAYLPFWYNDYNIVLNKYSSLLYSSIYSSNENDNTPINTVDTFHDFRNSFYGRDKTSKTKNKTPFFIDWLNKYSKKKQKELNTKILSDIFKNTTEKQIQFDALIALNDYKTISSFYNKNKSAFINQNLYLSETAFKILSNNDSDFDFDFYSNVITNAITNNYDIESDKGLSRSYYYNILPQKSRQLLFFLIFF